MIHFVIKKILFFKLIILKGIEVEWRYIRCFISLEL